MGNVAIPTERLMIRHFIEGDLEDLAVFIRDKMASKYAPYDTQWPTNDEGIKGILGYYIGNDAWYAVEHVEDKRVIGFVTSDCTDVENQRGFGYSILSAYQNKGYAYEACCALMEHCKSVYGTKKFVAGTADSNIPSVKLLTKLGFIKTQSIEGSFTKDSGGNPIKFPAGFYELNC